VRRAEDPLRVARMAAADLLVLKVQPLGGVRACLELAESAGLPVVVSSALESSVGIAAGVALAAALPEGTFRGAPLAAGLATSHLLRTDVTSAPLLPVDGHLEVRPITPDAVTPAPDDVAAAWLARLDRVAALAGGAAGDRPIATGAQ
jgi:O-succinylbenzoate synthase